MLRSRPMLPFLATVAVVASLLACGAPGTRGEPTPVLGPYSVARASGIAPTPPAVQDSRANPSALHETRRMCSLRGNRGSC